MGMQCSPLAPSAVASIKWATTMVNDDSEAAHHDLDKENGVNLDLLFVKSVNVLSI